MKLKLATATAIVLVLASQAHAANSLAIVGQSGDHHQALVNQATGGQHGVFLYQGGARNNANVYQANVQNQYYGGAGNALGVQNSNVAIQQGNDNVLNLIQSYIGSNRNEVGTSGRGFEQYGNSNIATINQLSARNSAGEVVQDGNGNNLSLNQGGGTSGYGYNRVRSSMQFGTGNGSTVNQTGQANVIAALRQDGTANTSAVSQSGNLNALTSLSQNGSNNVASVNVAGNNNGSTAGSTPDNVVLGSFAVGFQDWYLAQGSVSQTGNWNTLSHTVSGNLNLAALRQNGSYNDLGASAVGSGNQLAVNQNGDGNVLDVFQHSSGNKASVQTNGNSNNNGAASFTGYAAAAAGSLTKGVIYQGGGDGNSTLINVGGLYGSHDNMFATVQNGALNTITADVNGSYNQFVVTQNGSTNTAGVSQTGNGNNVGIVQ